MIFKQFEGFPSQHFSSCFSIFDITFIVEYKVKKGKKMVSHSRASSPVGLRSVHARRHVAATCRDGTSKQQIASCALEYFCENLCSATEFCRSNMLQKIKSDRICVTCRGNKILLQRQRFFHKISPVHTK